MICRIKDTDIKKILLLSAVSFLYFMSLWFIGRIYLADNYYNSALAMEKEGKWLDAIPLYEKAISINHNDVNFYERLGRLYFLRSWFPLDRQAFLLKAKDTMEKGLCLCPQNGELWLGLGMVSEGLLNKDDALTFYNKAVSLDPNNAFYHTAFATFYLKEGIEKKGIWEARKAISCYNAVYVYDYLKRMGVDEKTLRKIKEDF
jgi:tetratricopeptide (TPR) repeat protein